MNLRGQERGHRASDRDETLARARFRRHHGNGPQTWEESE